MPVYPKEYQWGEICNDSTPFCLIYSVSFSKLARILFIINVRPVYNKPVSLFIKNAK